MEDIEKTIKEMDASEKLDVLAALADDLDEMGQDEMVRDASEYLRAYHLAMSYEGETGRDKWLERASEIMGEMRRRIGDEPDENTDEDDNG